MRVFLYSTLSLIVHLGLSQIIDQTNRLKAFASWGQTATAANGNHLQATIGEAIVFETGTNFTQGFNQPNDVVCLPLAFEQSETVYSLCEEQVELSITPKKGTVTWLYNNTPIQGATAYTYTPVIPGTYTAQTLYRNCEETASPKQITAELAGFEVVATNDAITPTKTANSYQWYIILQGQAYRIQGAASKSYTPLYNGNYFVHLTDEDCLGTSSTYNFQNPRFDNALRYATYSGDAVSLTPTLCAYPNPTNAQLFVSAATDKVSITIYDLLGNQLLHQNHRKGQPLDVSTLQGVYIVALFDGQQLVQQKITIH